MSLKDPLKIYPSSVYCHSKIGDVFMMNYLGEDMLVAGKNSNLFGDKIDIHGEKKIAAKLTHQNAVVLRELFPFTAPTPIMHHSTTIGTGDRLGIATSGHIRAFNRYNSFYPVLAQQSQRELNATNRSFAEIIDSATFSVFKNNFQRGFGADGDHLKKLDEIIEAIDQGCTMITLDCSDYLDKKAVQYNSDEISTHYKDSPELEAFYLNKRFQIPQLGTIKFDELEFKRDCLIFLKAIGFIREVYFKVFHQSFDRYELEVSIDETDFPTTTQQHFFLASELNRLGVKFASLAPRFVGKFEKGIDYIGDLAEFEENFKTHFAIAQYFGYKISIHSGSDKFSLYPIIGKISNGEYHLKTSGTSWLEAMKVIAVKSPQFFREIYKYAVSVFSEAKKNYEISSVITDLPNIDVVSNEQVSSLFEIRAVRQLIHICYGFILLKKDASGINHYRNRLYKLWEENYSVYFDLLENHISNHFSSLNCQIDNY